MFSPLQRFILRKTFKEGKVTLRACKQFYLRVNTKPTLHDQANSISRSIERLIEKGMLKGRGRRTAEKWFLEEVALTSIGRKHVRTLLFQQPLPLFTSTYGNRTKSKKASR